VVRRKQLDHASVEHGHGVMSPFDISSAVRCRRASRDLGDCKVAKSPDWQLKRVGQIVSRGQPANGRAVRPGPVTRAA